MLMVRVRANLKEEYAFPAPCCIVSRISCFKNELCFLFLPSLSARWLNVYVFYLQGVKWSLIDGNYLQTGKADDKKSWVKFLTKLGVSHFPKARKKTVRIDTRDDVRLLLFLQLSLSVTGVSAALSLIALRL